MTDEPELVYRVLNIKDLEKEILEVTTLSTTLERRTKGKLGGR